MKNLNLDSIINIKHYTHIPTIKVVTILNTLIRNVGYFNPQLVKDVLEHIIITAPNEPQIKYVQNDDSISQAKEVKITPTHVNLFWAETEPYTDENMKAITGFVSTMLDNVFGDNSAHSSLVEIIEDIDELTIINLEQCRLNIQNPASFYNWMINSYSKSDTQIQLNDVIKHIYQTPDEFENDSQSLILEWGLFSLASQDTETYKALCDTTQDNLDLLSVCLGQEFIYRQDEILNCWFLSRMIENMLWDLDLKKSNKLFISISQLAARAAHVRPLDYKHIIK